MYDEFTSDVSWQHNGDTPGCNLNDPADGDITIYSDTP